MADTPTWKELKTLLDSDDVSAEEKKQLVLLAEKTDEDAQNSNPDDNHGGYDPGPYPRGELNDYADKLKISDEYKSNFLRNNDLGGLGEKYADAKKQKDENHKHRTAVSDAKDTLKSAKKAADSGTYGGAGVRTSDALLDPARPGLKYFRDFLPLYAKVAPDHRADGIHVGSYQDAVKRYDEQAGIPFWKFSDQVDELNKAAGKLDDADSDMAKKLSSLFDHWKGDAAKRAQEFYGHQHEVTHTDVVGKISGVAGLLQTSITTVATLVRGKADWVLKTLDDGNETVSGKTREEWSLTIACASDHADEDTLRRTAAIWGVHLDDKCGLNGDNARKIRAKARDVTKRLFVHPVSQDWKNFIAMCDRTRRDVDTAWSKVTSQADGVSKDPYARKGGDAGHQAPHGHGATGHGGQHASGGGGGGGGAGSYTPPPVSSPGAGGPPPAVTAPAAAHAAPDLPSAPPSPGTPAQRPDPETVTIRDGAGTIRMTSPDGRGHLRLTVDDGSGPPKTYDVDFGQDSPATGAGPLPAGEASPGGVPAPGAPQDQVAGTAQPPAEIHADDTGQAVIHDGDETITLQRSAADPSRVAVTVDDGSGEPATYTVNYAATGGAEQLSTVDTPAAVGAGAPGADAGGGQAPAGTAASAVGGAPGTPAAAAAQPGGPAPTSTTPAAVTGVPGIATPAGTGPGTAPFAGDPAGAGAQPHGEGMPGVSGPAQPAPGGQVGVAGAGVAAAGTDHLAGPGAPGVSAPAQDAAETTPGGSGGMMPMGGGAGAGGGQGGDGERGASQWRTTGDLFDGLDQVDEATGFRAVNGILGEFP